ncbi:hypothetical protein [Emticicia sp. C21]|uniref:hypothetical protein n=1 Tax=Emticicia sp. C21 TaxID=2302915 RepID=UPI0018F60D0C|nr:hypothetical protein [Emticicia sp. C21]
MEKEKNKINLGGRGITDYLPDFEEQAYNYCLLGATNESLAEFFGVSTTTLKKWMKKYPGFKESVRRGKELTDMKVAASLYKRAIGYNYLQVALEFVKAPPTQTKPKKVTDTVGTFLNEESLEAPATQTEPEKVTDMVGTFLKKETVNVPVTETELEKVTHMVGTFLNEPSDGLKKIRITTKEVIPDTRAQIFWLKNRRPDLWRDKREVKDTPESENRSYIRIFELPNDHRND